jgi:hypothetical protein
MFRPNPIQKRRARREFLCTGQLLTLAYAGIDLGLINQSELRKGYEHAWVCEESPTKQFEILGRQGSSGRNTLARRQGLSALFRFRARIPKLPSFAPKPASPHLRVHPLDGSKVLETGVCDRGPGNGESLR